MLKNITLEQLLSITSGSTIIALGNNRSEGDYYWSTVEGNNWIYSGTLVDFMK